VNFFYSLRATLGDVSPTSHRKRILKKGKKGKKREKKGK
jgi:hypothetical protein